MRTIAMATNGGPHSAEYMAESTARQILEVGEHVQGERLNAARKLENEVIDILVEHHATVLDGERAALEEHGADRYAYDFDVGDHVDVDAIADEICAAVSDSPFAALVVNKEFKSGVEAVLERHFRTSIYMTRSWHADARISDPRAVAFRQKFHGGN